jgi:hypothetical protein
MVTNDVPALTGPMAKKIGTETKRHHVCSKKYGLRPLPQGLG